MHLQLWKYFILLFNKTRMKFNFMESFLVCVCVCVRVCVCVLFLSGVIHVDEKSYGLKPVPQSRSSEHLLYTLDQSGSEPFVCGLSNTTAHTDPHPPHHLSLALLLRVSATLNTTCVCVCVCVCVCLCVCVCVCRWPQSTVRTPHCC